MEYILSNLHRNLIQHVISCGTKKDYYMCVCSLEQALSDSIITYKHIYGNCNIKGLQEELKSARKICIELAEGLIDNSIYINWNTIKSKLREWSNLTLNYDKTNDSIVAINRSMDIYELKVPECSAYDLCDLEVCYTDADNWINNYSNKKTKPILIAIRTGGSFIAPFWAARLKKEYGEFGFVSIRPVRSDSNEISYSIQEVIQNLNGIDEKIDVIIVDDQPDTGKTVLGLINTIDKRCNDNLNYWVSSPGRLYDTYNGQINTLSENIPVANLYKKRLWEVYGNEMIDNIFKIDNDIFKVISSKNVMMKTFERPFLKIYGNNETFKHWTELDKYLARRICINPRKSPFMICNSKNGKVFFTAKFIGIDIFGEYQFNLIKKFHRFIPCQYFYYDGYLITEFEDGLENFKDIYHKADDYNKKILCRAASNYWITQLDTMTISDNTTKFVYSFRTTFSRKLYELSQLLQEESLLIDEWIEEYVPEFYSLKGSLNTLVRSSIKYSHNYWHWKVKQSNKNIELRKFHIDFLWGSNNCIDLEIASFALENQLEKSSIHQICMEINPKYHMELFAGVLERLPEALYLNIDSWVRKCKPLSKVRTELIKYEFFQMVRYIVQMRIEKE